jgi:hypothetical protein
MSFHVCSSSMMILRSVCLLNGCSVKVPDIKVLFFTGFGDELFREKRMLAAYEA